MCQILFWDELPQISPKNVKAAHACAWVALTNRTQSDENDLRAFDKAYISSTVITENFECPSGSSK